jgi:ribose 5-phosphate isomerase RpiB
VREESQIEDMRAAVRGDRERAERARQRSTENVLGLIERPELEETAEPRAEPEPRRGLLGRLFGR